MTSVGLGFRSWKIWAKVHGQAARLTRLARLTRVTVGEWGPNDGDGSFFFVCWRCGSFAKLSNVRYFGSWHAKQTKKTVRPFCKCRTIGFTEKFAQNLPGWKAVFDSDDPVHVAW